MKIWDRHFLRHAGAEPPRQIKKAQDRAANAYVKGLVFEKPLNSPDRPSNIDRAASERPIPDCDTPSKIAGDLSAFRPPPPPDPLPPPDPPPPQGMDLPLELRGVKSAPLPLDLPSDSRSAAGAPAPQAVDLPAESRGGQSTPPLPLDLPADQRAPAPAPPEQDLGRVVRETA